MPKEAPLKMDPKDRIDAAEPLSNLFHPCKEHEAKPGGFKGQDPKVFVGRLVKLGFLQPDGKHKEHMWVKVLKLGNETQLEGVLDNDPFYVTDYKYGDGVGFDVEEIETVVPPL